MDRENKRRIKRAGNALMDYDFNPSLDGDEVATCVADLLADLRHLCDTYGVDFAAADKQAYMHYHAEKYGDEFTIDEDED